MATITLAVPKPVGVAPSGAVDGVNLTFSLPMAAHPSSATVWHNGLRLHPPDDFTWSESGGPGTGYDTLVFVPAGAPRPGDRVLVDY